VSRRRGSLGPQLSFDLGLGESAEVLEIDTTGQHGEVFTRRWVVDLILDLAGYSPDVDLASRVAVEPSCGVGAFLVPMVERLIESCRRHGRTIDDARGAIRAFDLLPASVEMARKAVVACLVDAGTDEDHARSVADGWVRCGDFLLTTHAADEADFVLGNPPYIRLEDMPHARSVAYRRACPTMRGRSDIFVGFIEVGLRLLRPHGVLGFIVADRWMHNQYGAGLRQLVASEYSVETVISMHDVDAFEEPVSAYPAITVIRRSVQGRAVVAEARRDFGESDGQRLRRFMAGGRSRHVRPTVSAAKLPTWFGADASWPSGEPANLALVADLERRFPPLEDRATGTRVGIGVASGADNVYLTRDPNVVEAERLLPLLMTADTTDGRANWSGTYLVNPWDNGRLVDLDAFPRLREHLDGRQAAVRQRHVARKNPKHWYRTIDRVEPGLLEQDKLLIPELKSYLQPVLDRGDTYPHHGLYFVTSQQWDLEVLGGILLSDIAELFVATYCVKMRGGCYRFQAQYLRRIRVPPIDSIDDADKAALRHAFRRRDRSAASDLARRLYGVDGLAR